MGQINCQCQYISNEEYDSLKRQSDALPLLTTQQSEPTQIITKLVLRSTSTIIEIPLSEATKSTYGTTEDCQQRHQLASNAHFKMEVRYRNRCAFLKDCGIGLGAFMMKRRLVRRAGSAEVFLGVCDKWIVLRILSSRQLSYCLFTAEESNQAHLDAQEDQEIDLGSAKLSIKRDEEGKEWTIRRTDRRAMWVLLGEERRVKARDMLRLGLEVFEVESVSSYLQSSKVIKKY